jgi:dynein assembly factor with WDR repeat domains 1
MGKIHSTLKGHDGELVSLHFNTDGDLILTGSFDKTAMIWDARVGEPVHILKGHTGEISSTQFEFTGEYCATSSIDGTCKLWDVRGGKCVKTF